MAGGFSLLQELIRGGLTCMAAFIAFWLALRSYRYNQWWDTRRQTYQKAVQTLYDCSRAFKKRTILSRIDPNKQPDKRVEIQDADKACHKVAEDLERLIHEGVFNMSPQALYKLRRAVNVIRNTFDGSKIFTLLQKWERAHHEITKLEESFALIAKDDLKVSPFVERKQRQLVRLFPSLDRKRHQLLRLFLLVTKGGKSFFLNRFYPWILTIWFGEGKARRILGRAFE